MVINTNLAASRAAMYLDGNSKRMATSLARLSSGSKIVQPQDDAAGLAQSLKLDSKVRRLDASISNNTNFWSMLQTQDGLAQEIQSALNRMNELAVLYQDVTKTADDKAAYNLEFQQLETGIIDMTSKTFNGIDLFFTDGKVFTGDSSTSNLTMNNVADGLGGGEKSNGNDGEYKIDLVYEANASGTELKAGHKAIFEKAANRIEGIITGDLTDEGSIDDLEITAAYMDSTDGVGGTLASAGPDGLRASFLPYIGTMYFDEADMDSMYEDGTLYAVVLHEMLHVTGIGTLWDGAFFDLIGDSGGSDPYYTGTNAIAKYNEIFGTNITQLPIEDDGGIGTAEGHWEENETHLAVDGLDNELMTGYVESSSIAMPLSEITVGSLEDMTYEVNYDMADPYSGSGTGSGPAAALRIDSLASIKGAIQGLANSRAQIGAQLSYTNKVNGALAIERENMMQATSRIKDVDIAEETTLLAKSQILVRSATAMTSQANVLPEMALMLIR